MNAKTPLSVVALGALTASAGILFEEDFTNYNDKGPGVITAEGVSYTSDPIYGPHGWVNAELKADADLYVAAKALPAKNAFDLLFTEELSATNSAFDVVFTMSGGRGATALPDLVIPFAGDKGRRDIAFKAADGKLALFRTEMNRYAPVRTFDLAGELKTVNFRIKAGGKVRLTKIVIRTPEPLPTNAALDQFPELSVLNRGLDAGRAGTPCPPQVSDGTPLDLAGKSWSFVPGATGTVGRLEVTWDSGNVQKLPIVVEDERYSSALPSGGYAQIGVPPRGKWIGPDAVIRFGQIRQFVRPHLKCFTDWRNVSPKGLDVVRDWDQLPPASKHVTTVEVRDGHAGRVPLPDGGAGRASLPEAAGFSQFWIDGSFVATFTPDRSDKLAKKVTKVELVLDKGVKYRANAPFDGRTLQLWVHPKAKAFAGVATDSADVALAHYAKGNYSMTEDAYTLRSPLDGYPGEVRFRLPAAPYAAATIRFVLDDAPGKVPYLAARFAKYRGGGAGCTEIEDSVLDLTKGIPDSVRTVDEIVRNGKKYPVYETTIELPLGKCLDFAAGDFIDLDFLGPMKVNTQQCDDSQKPRDDVSSAFNLLAVTVEKLNVLPELVQLAPGNVFTEDEDVKATAVKLTALVDNAKGVVTFGDETREYALAKAGEVVTNTFAFTETEVGIYRTMLTVECECGGAGRASLPGDDGRAVAPRPPQSTLTMRHEIVSCITPEAGRLVPKADSPYGTWWFVDAHWVPSNMDVGCPLLEKAGIKRCQAKLPKSAYEKYDVTFSGFVYAPRMSDFDQEKKCFKPHGKLDGEAWFVKYVQDQIAKCDTADHLMVWHESAPNIAIPEELLGLPVPTTDRKREQEMAAYVNEVGRLSHKHFPKLRVQIGNTGSSIGAAVVPLRGGAKPEYYDAIGMEPPSETVPPERMLDVAYLGQNVAKAAAKKISGRDLKTDGCYEFAYRTVRDLGTDGEHLQAEFHARDLLISLMHGYKLISPGLFIDCRNAYCATVWGASGIIGRGPFVYPKKAYLAYAVLTKVMDGVTFVREIPTGSPTVYAAEFRRLDGKYATAFWCARGEADLVCDVSGELWTMYGKRESVGGWFWDAKFAASTSPSYVISSKPCKSVRIAARRFPADAAFAQKATALAADFSLANVTVAPDPDLESQHHNFTPYMKPGVVTAKDIVDPEEGACLELTLDTDAKPLVPMGELVTEYTTVRLKKPVEVPGVAGLLGLRVKGDSGWGQVRFEIEDAKGEVFKGLTTGRDWGCDIYDWPGYTALSFDGWGDVYQTTDDNYFGLAISPGPRDEQWVSATGGNKKIDWPVKLRAVSVSFNRYRSDLLGFTLTQKPTIRIKCAWSVPAK